MNGEPNTPFQQLLDAALSRNWDEMRRVLAENNFNRHVISFWYKVLTPPGIPEDLHDHLQNKHDSSLATL